MGGMHGLVALPFFLFIGLRVFMNNTCIIWNTYKDIGCVGSVT